MYLVETFIEGCNTVQSHGVILNFFNDSGE